MSGLIVGTIAGMSYARAYPEYTNWFFRQAGRIMHRIQVGIDSAVKKNRGDGETSSDSGV